MERLKEYSNLIQQVLKQYAALKPANMPEIENQLIFDEKHDRYQLFSVGWEHGRRIHACIFHLDIINGKIWIQEDNTDRPIAQELMDLGVPKTDIVLAFQDPYVRQHSGFAVA